MPSPTIPYTFVSGTLAKSSEVNSNFDSLRTWLIANAIQKDASLAFTAVPSGPATDPSAANQLARKAYVDAKAPTVANVTHPTGVFAYASTFMDTGDFTLTESTKVRLSVMATVGSNEAHTMLLRYEARLLDSPFTVTEFVNLAVNQGNNRNYCGVSDWKTLPAGNYRWRGVVNAIFIAAGSVTISNELSSGNQISVERVRA